MALVKCPDCGKEVSDQAPACPNCGRPIAQTKAGPIYEDTGGLRTTEEIPSAKHGADTAALKRAWYRRPAAITALLIITLAVAGGGLLLWLFWRPGLTRAQVIRVIDGDTIEVRIGSANDTVRLVGMDTPETVHPRKPVPDCGGGGSERKGTRIVRQPASHLGTRSSRRRAGHHAAAAPAALCLAPRQSDVQ